MLDEKKVIGVGLGGAAVATGLAICPLQIALLGALGFLRFLERLSPALYLAAVGFGAVALYGIVRLRRSRRTERLAYLRLRREAPGPRGAGSGGRAARV